MTASQSLGTLLTAEHTKVQQLLIDPVILKYLNTDDGFRKLGQNKENPQEEFNELISLNPKDFYT